MIFLFFHLIGLCLGSYSFQLHSYNDLNEWDALIAKVQTSLNQGSLVYFKIDGHYMPPEFCVSQPRVKNASIGCLVLSHDVPNDQFAYFTSDDVISFLYRPETAWLLNRTGNQLILYLVGKDGPYYPPVNSNWSSELWSAWEYGLLSAIQSQKINVSVVSDGPRVPGLWPTTFCPNGDDIKNLTSCYYSNNGDCLDYQVLNCPALPIPLTNPAMYVDDLCPTSFGNVFWEPTDQYTMLEIFNAYKKCGKNHPAGIDISINIDPSQFWIYSAPVGTGISLNQHLIENATFSFSFVVSSSPFTLLVLWSNSSGPLYSSVFSANALFQSVQQLGVTQKLSSSFLITAVFKQNFLLTLTQDQSLLVFKWNGKNLVFQTSAILPNASTTLAIELLPNPKSNIQILIQSYATLFDTFLNQWTIDITTGSLSLLSSSLKIAPKVDSLALALTPFSNIGQLMKICPLSSVSAIGFISGSLPNGTLLLSFVCMNSKNFFASSPVLTANGRQPSLHIYQINQNPSTLSDLLVLSAAGESSCTNSDWHNKRSYPLLCSANDPPSKFALNYNYGSFEGWLNKFFFQPSPNFPLINTCSRAVYHGTYDSGSFPHVALTQVSPGQFALVSAHMGVPVGSIDIWGCGPALQFSGMVLDQWLLPNLLWTSDSNLETPMQLSSFVSKDFVPQNLCDECKQDLSRQQIAAMLNYQLIDGMTRDAAASCYVDHWVFGDGSRAACENIIYNYGNELMVEAVGVALDPSNCDALPICQGFPASPIPKFPRNPFFKSLLKFVKLKIQ